MKRKFSLIFLIVGLMVIGSLTVAEEADAHPLDGQWTLNYEWRGAAADSAGNEGAEPDGTTSWTIKK